MNYWYYADKDHSVIRVSSVKQPSHRNVPKTGTWVCDQLVDGRWVMPAFPEVTLVRLNLMKMLGTSPTDQDVPALPSRRKQRGRK